MGAWIGGLLFAGFLLLVALAFIRVLLSGVGLGQWACSKGWHWYEDFPLHTRQGLTGRTTTYRAVAGIKVERCRTCGRFDPPEGQTVYEQWKCGGITTVGGGLFSSPKVKADREASRAIGATLAATIAAAPPRKPKPPPPRWKVVIGSWSVVQVLGKYVLVAAGIGAMICLVGTLGARNGSEVVEMLLWAAGLGGFAWFLASVMDVGMSRYVARKQAAEATRDPVGYYERCVKLAREHGVEVPANVAPEALAESVRQRAERE